MSEKKNHLDIEGAQAKEDEHIATYKPIPEADTEFRSSKPNLSKSREKVSDEAAEKLLKEDQVAIRVDMADAKYVVGDHRNGDAKIELDANKRQFSGLTKEELMKYADDPFWVRLRWFMFALFWALWLCMLVGAIVIIVTAPKCAAPPPKTRFQKGPLVDLSSSSSLEDLESSLEHLKKSKIQAIFIPGSIVGDTYDVLEEENALDQIKGFIKKAKDYGVGVVVDLTANFVPKTHKWFLESENRTAPFVDYFVWADGGARDDAGNQLPPTNWVSTINTPAWQFSDKRQQFFLSQHGVSPDLDFRKPAVVALFDKVLKSWMAAGAAGVRLHKARSLVISSKLQDEQPHTGAIASQGADHAQYAYYRHTQTSDQPGLDDLLAHWAHLVDSNAEEGGTGNSVFTIYEDGDRPELMLLSRNLTSLRPPSAAARDVDVAPTLAATEINKRLGSWPALQLKSSSGVEVTALSLLLPAAPILLKEQVEVGEGNATEPSDVYLRLVALRSDASVEHGQWHVAAAKAANGTGDGEVLVVTRWKAGHTGYAAVWNPSTEAVSASVTAPAMPESLTLHAASTPTLQYANYTHNQALSSANLLVPPRSTLVLSFVPKTTAEN